MGEAKQESKLVVKSINVRYKEGQRFSRDDFIKKCGYDTEGKDRGRKEDIERWIGETLRNLSNVGFIVSVGKEKSTSRGRPSIIYSCAKGLSFRIIPDSKEDEAPKEIKCPKCGHCMEVSQ